MDLARIKEFLFRHVEKLVLGLVILFVGYRVYVNLFGGQAVQPARGGIQAVPAPIPGGEIDASFWQTASPFLCPPSVEGAKYNWFYPPKTHWAYAKMGLVLVEGTKGNNSARVPVRGKVRRKPDGTPEAPQVTTLTEDERASVGVPVPSDRTPPTPCEIDVAVVPPGAGEPAGDVLAIKAVKAGSWVRVMVMLENQDRFCVPVSVAVEGTELTIGLTIATIGEIKEEPLGTVAIRFNAKRGVEKQGNTELTYIEPTYFEILRKGERDAEEATVGRVPGRDVVPAEPGAGHAPVPTPVPMPKADEPAGFPGAHKKAAPKAKGGLPPAKGAPTADTGEMVFEDLTAEAELAYTYRIRSVLVPGSDVEKPIDPVVGEPKSYRTLPRFTFAYLGGDAQHAKIRVYIGPRDDPQGSRDYERVPIGGWVGEVPKEFRPAPDAAEEPPAEAPKGGPAKGAPAKAKGEPAALSEAAASARFVTRCILVDIEQGVFRPMPQNTRRPVPDGMGGFKVVVVKTFRETQDRRVILRDAKNRLHYLWREEAATPPPPPKGK